MRTRNLLILITVSLLAIFILISNAKTTIYKLLNIETDDEKIARLTINNKQQKEALKQKEEEQKIQKLTSKIELNTTMAKDATKAKLTNKITALKTDIKLDTNKTKILTRIKKEFKIATIKTNEPKHKEIHRHKKETKHHYYKKHTIKCAEEPTEDKVTVNRSTYLIYGYKDIKAIYSAYNAVLALDKKDKK